MLKIVVGLSLVIAAALSALMIPVTEWARTTDTSLLAFEVFEKNVDRQIYIADPAHRISVSLTRNSEDHASSPTWSADHKLAYVSEALNGDSAIYVFDLKENRLVNITRDTGEVTRQPSWSPDGRQLAFTAWRGASTSDIYVADLASSQIVAVTNTPEDDYQPVWLSNSELVFVSDMQGKPQQVYLLNLADFSLQHISNNDDLNRFPVVARSQRLVAYTTVKPTDQTNMSLNVWDEQSHKTVKVMSGRLIAGFDWSVEGNLALSFYQNGHFQIYVWDRRQGAIRRVTNSRVDNAFPTWSVDGKIAFQSNFIRKPRITIVDPLTLAVQEFYSTYRSEFPEWSK
jgi:Tol biopolymer transport system component